MPLDPQLKSMMLARMSPAADDTGDDENVDTSLDAQPTPSLPPPVSPMTQAAPQQVSPGSASRQQLYQMLIDRRAQQEQNDNQYLSQREGLIGRQGANRTNENTNSFLNALNRSASQFGTLGGQKASTSAPAEQAQELRAGDQESEKQMQEDLGRSEKVGEGRLGGLDKGITSLENRLVQDDTKRLGLAQLDATRQQTHAYQLASLGQRAAHQGNQDATAASRAQTYADSYSDDGGGLGGPDPKQTANDEKMMRKTNHDITGEVATGRSAFGQAAARLQRGGTLEALIQQIDASQGGKPTDQQYKMLLTDFNAMIGGPTAEKTIEGLDPRTAKQYLGNLIQQFSGQPVPIDLAGFMNTMKDQIGVERKFLSGEIKRVGRELLAGDAPIAKRNPDAYAQMLAAHGINMDDVFPGLQAGKGLPLPPRTGPGPAQRPQTAAPGQPPKPIPVKHGSDLP